MFNIKLIISYDGTRYAGWQIQKKEKTIQQEFETALRKIFGEKIKITGAGRTDTGVHAKGQVANFLTEKYIPAVNLRSALNANLPDDISVHSTKYVPATFHARYSAKSKIYRYTILNASADNPFLRRYYYKMPQKLNISLMAKEARTLIGMHDFKAFQAKDKHSTRKNTIRTIKGISVKKRGNFIYIDIEADGFLHNMVRNIVGTLIEIGRGRLQKGSLKKILDSKSRNLAGPTAPARGLSLLKVKYR